MAGLGASSQRNLRNRVAQVSVINKGNATTTPDIETYYDYDEHGNVATLYHKVAAMGGRLMSMQYSYDLISNKVNKVSYQAGEKDQFYHRYEYDADNRLTSVYTSEDSYIWERDARYFYYLHGPLARVELGQDKVQAMDYIYTMLGWIKSVNLPGTGSQVYEPGRDGHKRGINRFFGRDEMSYVLGYNDQDYKAIGGTGVNLGTPLSNMWNTGGIVNQIKGINGKKGLYNGNIVAMITDIKAITYQSGMTTSPLVGQEAMMATAYQYDALHRIKESNDFTFNGTAWGTAAKNNKTNYSYDPNGNITTLQRYNGTIANLSTKMDNLTYGYNKLGDDLLDNRLASVSDIDNFAGTPNFDNRGVKGTTNFKYDGIGNLIEESEIDGGITKTTKIEWNVYGKVAKVTTASGSIVSYTYDAAGNRLTKTANNKTTVYIRDATGNALATYQVTTAKQSVTTQVGKTTITELKDIWAIQQQEVSLYGSSRLGLRKWDTPELTKNPNGTISTQEVESERRSIFPYHGGIALIELPNPSGLKPLARCTATRGNKFFELSNHLGNVLTVITDQKVWNTEGGVGYYAATVVSATDYYAFGMAIAGRKFSPDKYRYGFNGKENDSDWGTEMIQDYGFRIYSPSIAKFLSVDPLFQSYPYYTPYQFAGNSPIEFIDIDGAEEGYTKAQMDNIIFLAERGYIKKYTDPKGKTAYLNELANKWFYRHTAVSGESYFEKPVGNGNWKSFNPEDANAEKEWSERNQRDISIYRSYKDMNKALGQLTIGLVATGVTGGALLYAAGTGALASAAIATKDAIGVGLRHVATHAKNLPKLALTNMKNPSNIIGAASDAFTQVISLSAQGKGLDEYNFSSTFGELFIGGKFAPFASAALGSVAPLSFKDGLKTDLINDPLAVLRNVALGTAGNYIGEIGFGDLAKNGFEKIIVPAAMNTFGNVLSTVFSSIAPTQKEIDDQKSNNTVQKQ